MRVFVIDDTPITGKLIANYLMQIDNTFPTVFSDPTTGLNACLNDSPDVILVDYMMPDINGLEFIKKIRNVEALNDVPILMITAMDDKNVLQQAFENGANDFLAKPVEPIELNARVLNMLNLRSRALQLYKLASTDSMTETLNRRRFFEIANSEFSRCKRYGNQLSIIMLDIDYFKHVNDKYGHAAGDEILKKIAIICKKILRDTDFIGRLGGEEFAICLPETKIKDAYHVAERIRKSIESEKSYIDGNEIYVTISAGLTQLNKNDNDFSAVLKRADQLLYGAKKTGRNKIIAENKNIK